MDFYGFATGFLWICHWISTDLPNLFSPFLPDFYRGSPVTGTLGRVTGFTARGAGAEISVAAIGGHLADTTRRMATWFL